MSLDREVEGLDANAIRELAGIQDEEEEDVFYDAEDKQDEPAASLNLSYFEPKYRLQLGATLTRRDNTTSGPSWTEVDGNSFMVRIGPDYQINKRKELSLPSICHLIGADLFGCEQKIHNIGRFIQLPAVPDCPAGLPPPATIIINAQIPAYAPPNPLWGRTKEDGQGYSLVFYLTLKDEWLREWRDVNTAVPAIQLLRRFVSAELDDEKMHERFKAITRIQNIPEINVAGVAKKLVNTYNGTPFLTRPQHRYYRGPNYFEIDVDVHRFSYMAKLGLAGVRQALQTVIFDFAFVVEGYTNDELPEQILGAARLVKLDLSNVQHFPTELLQQDS
eukprot:TRINITY_DN6178_c0_g3_i2.p1 TRINITY_DN6178_c0_g3~~TRINITY_DN6178_c0_g3_i2.p1  ORF type:complete len:345 (-),score=141.39 TRINITY_DN6178_c0_g3_i2:49-1047(-)